MQNHTKILIADDAPVPCATIKKALAMDNYEVLVANDGEQALNMYCEHRPSLIILDWMMPKLSGPEICHRIRTEFKDSLTHILLLSGITQKDKVVQVLEAGADDYLTKPFHAEELRARVHVGMRMVALRQELEEKNRWLQQLSMTDELTNIPNRRAVMEWVQHELRNAERYHYPLSLVMADLDHFKHINDTWGHAVGDSVLKRFAHLLHEHIRQGDLCGRFGGEEFIVILPHTRAVDSAFVVERFRAELALHQVPAGNETIHVTASFGISEFGGSGSPNLEFMLRAADEALYEAKRNGRDRCEIHTEAQAERPVLA